MTDEVVLLEQLGPDRRSAPRHLALSLAPVTACWRVIQLTLRRPGARGLIGGLLPLSRCLCPEARERPGSSGSPDGRSRFHHENGFKRFKVMRRPMRGGPGRRGGGGGALRLHLTRRCGRVRFAWQRLDQEAASERVQPRVA